MSFKIVQRQLTDTELDILIVEVKKFYSPVVGYKDKWKHFHTVYIALQNNNIVGICGVEKKHDWLMLNPFVVLEKYHRKGIGKALLKAIVQENNNNSIFIGSKNKAVEKIAQAFNFSEIVSPNTLPWTVKLYLFRFIYESINISFITEKIRKRAMPHGNYKTLSSTL